MERAVSFATAVAEGARAWEVEHMIRKTPSRSFLRMGYDVSEVLSSLLVDIERTIMRKPDPEKVSYQKAEDQEFP